MSSRSGSGSTAKKAASKKVTPAKAPTAKATTKKAAAKPATTAPREKTAAAKKPAAKAPAVKAAAKKPAPKSSAAKKPAAKKAAAKKSAANRPRAKKGILTRIGEAVVETASTVLAGAATGAAYQAAKETRVETVKGKGLKPVKIAANALSGAVAGAVVAATSSIESAPDVADVPELESRPAGGTATSSPSKAPNRKGTASKRTPKK